MRTCLLLALCILCRTMAGQTPAVQGQNQKFVHISQSGQLVLIETIEPGVTLYSLSRKYNLSLAQLLKLNPDLDTSAIPLGFPVNIPVNSYAITFAPPDDDESWIWLSYQVQPKETLYRISRVYLSVSPEAIIALNPSAAHGLNIGQVLHIGWLMPSENNNPGLQATTADSSRHQYPLDFIKEATTVGKVIHEQKGLAVWKPGAVSSNFYVMHPSAKVGSYMEITNPMLHRTITAKVSGNIPKGLYQSHVGIVVSPSTARALGVLDQHFFAKWRYVE